MSDPAPAVLSALEAGVLTVTLNRPDHGNAWNGQMAKDYFGILARAARDSDVRAILVTGAGTAFCVGGDGSKLGDVAETGDIASAAAHPYFFPLRVGKPIIAAINGACFGIGLQQALVADVRFASDGAKFSTAYARRGLAAEMGMSWLLPRLVGTGHAMDLLLSARLVRADEAAQIGLVNRVVPESDLLAKASTYARQLSELCSPGSMRAIKQQLLGDLDRPFLAGFRESEALLSEVVRGEDFKEGVRSWNEGRRPTFPGLPEDLALIQLGPGKAGLP